MVKTNKKIIIFDRVSELNEKAQPEIIIAIIGNKIDLENH